MYTIILIYSKIIKHMSLNETNTFTFLTRNEVVNLFLYICSTGFGGFGSFGAKQQAPTIIYCGGFGTGIGFPAFGQGKAIFLPLVLYIKQTVFLKHR